MRKTVTLLLIITLLVFAGVFFHNSQERFAVDYTLLLPDSFSFAKEKSGSGTIICQEKVVGGVLLCPYPEMVRSSGENKMIDSDSFVSHAPTILETLKMAGARGADSGRAMLNGSTLGADCQVWVGEMGEEYQHYLYFSEKGIVSLWFDLQLVDGEQAELIAAGFTIQGGADQNK